MKPGETVGDVLRAAYRRAKALPWQKVAPDAPTAVQLEAAAWTAILAETAAGHGFDLTTEAQYMPGTAIRFLVADDAERAQYDANHSFLHLPFARTQIILAAEAAGFKVDKELAHYARRSMERQLEREGRGGDPPAPPPWAVKHLKALRDLVARKVGRADFQERKVGRVERLKTKHTAKAGEASALHTRSRKRLENIPMGQPILVGHHSERRHRKDIERSHGDMRKAIAAADAAEALSRSIHAAESGTAISSDDPEALSKLQARVKELEEKRERWKVLNKAVRSKDPRKALAELGLSDETAAKLLAKDFAGRVGIPDYKFTNTGAEIRRLQGRITELQGQALEATPEDYARGPFRATWDAEENRVAIYSPYVAEKSAREAKAEHLRGEGFIWVRTRERWQRKANRQAWLAAVRAVDRLADNASIGVQATPAFPNPPIIPPATPAAARTSAALTTELRQVLLAGGRLGAERAEQLREVLLADSVTVLRLASAYGPSLTRHRAREVSKDLAAMNVGIDPEDLWGAWRRAYFVVDPQGYALNEDELGIKGNRKVDDGASERWRRAFVTAFDDVRRRPMTMQEEGAALGLVNTRRAVLFALGGDPPPQEVLRDAVTRWLPADARKPVDARKPAGPKLTEGRGLLASIVRENQAGAALQVMPARLLEHENRSGSGVVTLRPGEGRYFVAGWSFRYHHPTVPQDLKGPYSTLITSPGVPGPRLEGVPFGVALAAARQWAVRHLPNTSTEREPPARIDEKLLTRERVMRLEGDTYVLERSNDEAEPVGAPVFKLKGKPPPQLVQLGDGRWITIDESHARLHRQTAALARGQALDPSGDYGVRPETFPPPSTDGTPSRPDHVRGPFRAQWYDGHVAIYAPHVSHRDIMDARAATMKAEKFRWNGEEGRYQRRADEAAWAAAVRLVDELAVALPPSIVKLPAGLAANTPAAAPQPPAKKAVMANPSGPIRSDDPEALPKLRAKLAEAQKKRPSVHGADRRNLDSKIAGIERRIEDLAEQAAKAKPAPIERQGFRLWWDEAAHRVVIEGPDPGPQLRKRVSQILKARGFLWAPTLRRYQRLANEEAWGAGKALLQKLAELLAPEAVAASAPAVVKAEKVAEKAATKADEAEHKAAKAEAKAARVQGAAAKASAKQEAAKARADAKAKAKAAKVADKKAEKERKAAEKNEETKQRAGQAQVLCSLRVAERMLRGDLRRAERRATLLTKKHKAAVDKLTKARGGCTHGCKKTRKAECMAAPLVRVLARSMVDALAAEVELRHRHARVVEQLRHRGVETPPVRPLAPRRRDGAPPRSDCGTVCHIQVRDGLCGGQAAILLPSAQGAPREVPTRYCLLEAAQLIASHRPDDFSIDPRYPANTQERRYDRDKGEQLKVINIAQNPRPELVFSTSASPLDGTPVATVGGLVLGGNGRTLGVLRNYLAGGTDFRDYLIKVAHEFGFTPAQIRALKQPVIVRTIDPPPAEYVRLVRDLNQGLTQSMDAITEGVSLARQMPVDALDILANALGSGDTDLGEYFASRASLPFIGALERGGIVTQQNRGRLVRSDGLLTDEGRALAIRQIGASVLPDADLLERIGAELRNALARSAPFWLAAAAQGGAWDVRPQLQRAVRDLLAAQAAGLSLRRFFQQADLFAPPQTHGDPMARRMIVLLDKLGNKPAVLTRVAKYFAGEAAQHSGHQVSLLAPKTPVQGLDVAAEAMAKLDLPREIGALT